MEFFVFCLFFSRGGGRNVRKHLKNILSHTFLKLPCSICRTPPQYWVEQCGSKYQWIPLITHPRVPFSTLGFPKGLLFYSKRLEHFLEFSVAKNWAPLIFSCSHNQSNPLNPSNLHKKKKLYMNPEKNIFTKFIQVYTSNFLWDTLCHRGKRVKALTCLHIKCHNY